MAFQISQLVNTDHECADSGVERKTFGGIFRPPDRPVNGFPFSIRGFLRRPDPTLRLIKEKPPQLAEESEHTFNSLRIPWFALLDRAQEHFVHPVSVGPILFYEVVWINGIVQPLTHFFDLNAAKIFSVFEDKFGVRVLRAPFPEGLDVELCPIDHVDIDMKWRKCNVAKDQQRVVENTAERNRQDFVDLRFGA